MHYAVKVLEYLKKKVEIFTLFSIKRLFRSITQEEKLPGSYHLLYTNH